MAIHTHTVALWCAAMIQTCLSSQTLQHEYEWKGNSLFWPETCLLRRNIPLLPPTQCVVWGINQTQKKRNIFTFQICCISKAPLSVGYALYRAARQRIAQGEMTQVTNGWLGILLGLETHHYWEYESIRAVLQPIKTWPWVSVVGAGYIWDTFCIICWIIENVAWVEMCYLQNNYHAMREGRRGEVKRAQWNNPEHMHTHANKDVIMQWLVHAVEHVFFSSLKTVWNA